MYLLGFTQIEAPVLAVAGVADLRVGQAGEALESRICVALVTLELPLTVFVGPEVQMLTIGAQTLLVYLKFWILSVAAPARLRH